MSATLVPLAREQQDTAQSTFHLPLWAAWLSILLSVWLLIPAFTSAHVEAFSARIQSMAIMGLRGQFARDDLAYPLNMEYFYTTRGGTIHVLEWLMRLTHSTGELNFRILILLSFTIFIGSCLVFARRWSNISLWVAAAVIVLTPGLTEIAFFFADNLPSAAMAALAFACVGKRAGPLQWAAGGAALACATLLRLDAILAAPALLLLVFLHHRPRITHVLTNSLSALAAASAVLFLAWRVTTVSLLQALRVGRLHSALHSSWGDRMSPLRVLVLFFGPTVLLLALAVWTHWRKTTWRYRIVLVISPFLFYCYAVTRTVELRDYLLLLGPFVVLGGALGLTRFLHLLQAGAPLQHRAAQAAVLLYGLTLVAPPVVVLHDGPRLLLGRLYAPLLWERWQRSTDNAIEQVKLLAESAPAGQRTLVLSTYFQSDRYLHLALLEAGYDILPLRTNPDCGGVETYGKDGRTVLLIRTENPYFLLSAPPLSLPAEYVRAYQTSAGLACLPPGQYDRAYLDTWGTTGQGFFQKLPEFQAASGVVGEAFPAPGMPHLGPVRFLSVQRLLPLDAEEMDVLTAVAKQQMLSLEAQAGGVWHRPQTYEEFHRQAAPVVWNLSKSTLQN